MITTMSDRALAGEMPYEPIARFFEAVSILSVQARARFDLCSSSDSSSSGHRSATMSASSTSTSLSSLPADTDPQHQRRHGFFRRLFGKHTSADALASNEPSCRALITPRALPRALSKVPFTRTLLGMWGATTDGEVMAVYGSCLADLKTIRAVRVLAVADAASMRHQGVVVTMEVTTASASYSLMRQASSSALMTARTLRCSFADCRRLLKLLAFCVSPDCCCGGDGIGRESCGYREAVRQFLSVCWVRPPLVRPSAPGGSGARGISKGVLTASLNDIVELARRVVPSGSASDAKGVGTGPTTAGDPRLDTTESESRCATGSSTARCRARMEVSAVVRDFMFP